MSWNIASWRTEWEVNWSEKYHTDHHVCKTIIPGLIMIITDNKDDLPVLDVFKQAVLSYVFKYAH